MIAIVYDANTGSIKVVISGIEYNDLIAHFQKLIKALQNFISEYNSKLN